MPLDAAMSEARRAIANRVGNNEWATPVLYMRADDGVLFQTATIRCRDRNTSRVTCPADGCAIRTRSQSRRAVRRDCGVDRAGGWSIFGLARALFFPTPAPPTPTLAAALLPDLQIGTCAFRRATPRRGKFSS